jgi:tRNA(Ile)-lysidine synthase
MLVEKIQETIQQNKNVQGTVIVACSGGPDSICLLHAVSKIANLKNLQIICAHFDHRWNTFSNKATKVVEKLCSELAIPFIVGQAGKAGKNSEAEARDERYKFLSKVAADYNAQTLLTAHHEDDQIETFFLRLLRGTGPEGLACIHPVRDLNSQTQLVRPLLNFSKSELVAYCDLKHLYYYEDPSNKETDIKRNQIRSQLVPLIERIQPTYKKQICNLIQLLSADSEFVQNFANNQLPHEALSSCRGFAKQAVAIQRIILKKLLEENTVSVSFDLIETMREAILSKKKFKKAVGNNFIFESNSVRFKLYKSSNKDVGKVVSLEAISFAIKPLEVKLPNFGSFSMQEAQLDEKNIQKERNSNTVFVDLSKFVGCQLELRERLPKDRFKPLNSKHSTKLKSFLINRKVRQNFNSFANKENTLVLALKESSEVLWVLGIEISDDIKVVKTSTHCLTYSPTISA